MRTIELKLKRKLNEVFILEPTDLGNNLLTNLYHQVTSRFKTMPFIYILPLSILLAVVSYFILNYLLVKLVNLLQYGF